MADRPSYLDRYFKSWFDKFAEHFVELDDTDIGGDGEDVTKDKDDYGSFDSDSRARRLDDAGDSDGFVTGDDGSNSNEQMDGANYTGSDSGLYVNLTDKTRAEVRQNQNGQWEYKTKGDKWRKATAAQSKALNSAFDEDGDISSSGTAMGMSEDPSLDPHYKGADSSLNDQATDIAKEWARLQEIERRTAEQAAKDATKPPEPHADISPPSSATSTEEQFKASEAARLESEINDGGTEKHGDSPEIEVPLSEGVYRGTADAALEMANRSEGLVDVEKPEAEDQDDDNQDEDDDELLKMSDPVFDPPGGAYDDAQDVTIYSVDGADILYSINNDGNWVLFNDLIAVDKDTFISAIAIPIDEKHKCSDYVEAEYVITEMGQTDEPTVTSSLTGIDSGDGVVVTLGCETSEATIYHTTDGTDPDTSSSTETSFTLSEGTATIKMFASSPGNTDSEYCEETVVISVVAPAIAPDSATLDPYELGMGGFGDTLILSCGTLSGVSYAWTITTPSGGTATGTSESITAKNIASATGYDASPTFTVSAKATKSGYSDSATLTETYNLETFS